MRASTDAPTYEARIGSIILLLTLTASIVEVVAASTSFAILPTNGARPIRAKAHTADFQQIRISSTVLVGTNE